MTRDVNAGSWRSSSKCDSNACLEVLIEAQTVSVRDGSFPDAAVLRFDIGSWTAFLADIDRLAAP